MSRFPFVSAAAAALLCLSAAAPAHADGDLNKVNHIIVVMQENHSFDNYFGVLPYVPGTPYHRANPICSANDHSCIDGLTCHITGKGAIKCDNVNLDSVPVKAFHAPSRCILPDLDHSWVGSHTELNFNKPNHALVNPLNNGFVKVNEAEAGTQTISYFDDTDLPFYYGLAKTFAISDRQFASLVGPTVPNRFFLMAGTSFGHLTTNDTVPPPGGYKPITGTIFDLMEAHGVSWADYFEDLPQAALFRTPDSHTLPLQTFMLQAKGIGPALPQVVFIDPNLGAFGRANQDDEHPPVDIQRGQAHVSDVVNAIRNGPYWKDSVILITYDEHGGYYDHVPPPQVHQSKARTPDGIAPGQCADLSNPPLSTQPGGGANCATNLTSLTDTTLLDAEALCPALAKDPTGPYPAECASFDQLGIRVPMIAVSPFSKPAYVSHVERDHTAILRMIEERFMGGPARPHLTSRDLHVASLEDMFDFDTSPSLHTEVGTAGPPETDCTPAPGAITPSMAPIHRTR